MAVRKVSPVAQLVSAIFTTLLAPIVASIVSATIKDDMNNAAHIEPFPPAAHQTVVRFQAAAAPVVTLLPPVPGDPRGGPRTSLAPPDKTKRICWHHQGGPLMAKLFFYYSTMNAGKSTSLLQAAHNYAERGMRTMLFTARIDSRSSGRIKSRIGIDKEAKRFDVETDFWQLCRSECAALRAGR